MKLETPDLKRRNIEKIRSIMPEVTRETVDKNGQSQVIVDFDLLKSLLTREYDHNKEVYELTWPGKKECLAEAYRTIRKTLSPNLERSENWDTTENIYIEGDNLDVLKLLQESYLGIVKMIYIDPPYNTGNDMLYDDDFSQSQLDYDLGSGNISDDDEKLYKNPSSNGRYHSNWCSMIYPRLLLSRSLLSDNGIIFISIDSNELSNLISICNEIFGEENRIGIISNTNNPKGRSDDKYIATANEYILVYSKDINKVEWFGFEPTDEITKRYNKTDSDNRKYREIDLRKTGENDLREDRPNLFYYFYYSPDEQDFFPSREELNNDSYIKIMPLKEDGKEGNWRWSLETAKEKIDELVPKFLPNRRVWGVMQKDYLDRRDLVKPTSSWTFKDVNSERGTEQFIDLGFDKRDFPKSKPLGTIERCIKLGSRCDGDIILDFFSGSGTTAQAVMEMNSQDGIKRKFILVQIDTTVETKAARSITLIGEERIRRAASKINDSPEKKHNIDPGFRVFKVNSSNMKDIYYAPENLQQNLLELSESNIKDDRTDLDLLFGCLLEWGLELSKPYKSEMISGVPVHTYDDDALIACFAEKVPEEVIREIAKRQPLRAVFRDRSFENDAARVNLSEIFKLLSPDTEVKVL